jgi:hypothetical protein
MAGEKFTLSRWSARRECAPSISFFVGFGGPRPKNGQALIAKQFFHRNTPGLVGFLQFVVYECVVESRARGIGCRARIENACGTRPVNRAQAHGARLASRVQMASRQLESSERAACCANRDNFRMRRRIVRSGHLIGALADDAAVFRDERSEWAAAGLDISESQRNGAPHQRCRRLIVLAQAASSTVKSFQLESFASVSARINVPLAISSGEAYSSGRWL